jgi:hypothetical protein
LILREIVGEEAHPLYQKLEAENGTRQYDFLRSLVEASLAVGRPFLSQQILKALNFHAIACLDIAAGEFRPCQVEVGVHLPPPHYRVQGLMDDFVNYVNRNWETTDPVALASFVLWRLNFIHPFVNGNGRTARAACYFVLCVKFQGWLPGRAILPELIRSVRDRYVEALVAVDASAKNGALDLSPLHQLLQELLEKQIQDVPVPDEELPGAVN